MGAGYDNIDLNACDAAGVAACNVPDAWTEEVADSTMTLTLALVRKTFQLAEFVRDGGGWTRQAELQQRGIRSVI